jgi:hypothetical protein
MYITFSFFHIMTTFDGLVVYSDMEIGKQYLFPHIFLYGGSIEIAPYLDYKAEDELNFCMKVVKGLKSDTSYKPSLHITGVFRVANRGRQISKGAFNVFLEQDVEVICHRYWYPDIALMRSLHWPLIRQREAEIRIDTCDVSHNLFFTQSMLQETLYEKDKEIEMLKKAIMEQH